MNFSYGTDSQFRDLVGLLRRQHHTAVLFNSQEPAPDDGFYNSALLINEEGRLIAQYDKIRLMPFGEYVPLPQLVTGIQSGAGHCRRVHARHSLHADARRQALQAGVFICIESAYPWIARTFTTEGADVLINISNDGYLGPTAVMRQHLANAIFRAVENERPLLRVTNTGITAYITPNGEVRDATNGFQASGANVDELRAVEKAQTFYTRHGDLFVGICAVFSLLVICSNVHETMTPGELVTQRRLQSL